MKNFIIAAMVVIATISSANAQYGNQYGSDYNNGYNSYNDDRYYYDDEFDWHWDIRVRISNGIQNGLITNNEANRLYRQLENVERKEYAYQADGIFSSWEQQEIWDDVTYLNRMVGLELYDYDRSFYGFDTYGHNRQGYPRWYYQGGYDFYRFDKRGYGSIRLGYFPRPSYNGWYRNDRNRIGREYYNERSRYQSNYSRSNRGRYDNDHDSRFNSGNYGGNSRGNSNGGSYDNNRNSQPNGGNYGGNSRRNSNSGGFDNSGSTQPTQERPARGGFDNNSPVNRPSVEIQRNPSDNFGRGSGIDNSRSERSVQSQPNFGGGQSRGSRGESASPESPRRGNDSGGSRGESRGRRNEL